MTDQVAVFMLDVGQGDCTVVLLPNGNAVVFDCADDQVLNATLSAWKVPAIDAFILSHLDQDHLAGALQFFMNWKQPLSCVYLATDRDVADDHEEAKRAKALLDYAKEQSKDSATRKRRWELVSNSRDLRPVASGPGWSIRLLAPAHFQVVEREREGAWEDANRYSSILEVKAGGNTMLIGGDAPLLSWSELPDQERQARIFRIPHHGGALDDGGVPMAWDVDRLYKEVGAETALVSVGTNNGHEHPRKEWVEPITGGKSCRMLCTQVTARCHEPLDVVDSQGRVRRDKGEVEAQRNRVLNQAGVNHWAEPTWRHLTDKHVKIRRNLLEVPCAGTVVVSLFVDGNVQVKPLRGGDHESLVDTWLEPLCRAAP